MARSIRALHGFPPFEVFQHIVELNEHIDQVFLRKYVYVPLQFDAYSEEVVALSRLDAFDTKKLANIISTLPTDFQLGVNSEVRLRSGVYAHIPMMDFNIPRSASGISTLIERLRKANIRKGWILETEASYHYYGVDLLTQKEWMGFMGTCLLTSIVHSRGNIEQVADSRYIGHSLKRGFNTLRIVTRATKTFEPKVVYFID